MYRKRTKKKSIIRSNLVPALPVLFVALGILASCGLKELIYLAPINKDIISGSRILNYYEFTHNYSDNNIDEFKGYNIYYKLYRNESDTIKSDIASLENIYISTENTIKAKGFFPVCRNSTASLTSPLIDLEDYKDENVKIRINFANLMNSPQEEPTITVYKANQLSTPIESFVMRRNILDPDTQGEYKTFLYEDLISGISGTIDSDCTTVSSSIGARETIAVSLCVTAYGKDSNFSPLFSEVVFLNRTKDTDLAPLQISYY